jgi:hypothetical protein
MKDKKIAKRLMENEKKFLQDWKKQAAKKDKNGKQK